jgi:hypothetical protein
VCVIRTMMAVGFRRFMSSRSVLLVAFVVLLLTFTIPGTAKADSVNKVTIDGSVAFWDGNIGIPPYGGTLNGVKESFYCVDFSATIAPPYSWDANITSLTGSSFSLTNLKNQTTYLEMAWLVTQMMGAKTNAQKAAYQFAIWSFTGGPNYSTNSTLVAAALAAVNAGFKGQGFEILTPTGGSGGQEFLIYVPEPSELLMFIIGLTVLGVVTAKKRAAARAHAT